MVEQAVQAGADIVMLDNMSLQEMADAARTFGHAVTLEASGGVTLDSVGQVAATGVHAISVGALTHSAPATPFHLEFLV
jgi:nicotinate-nucleotide pyrophosphorylase (carboxylating)